jgi:hypothetical protein
MCVGVMPSLVDWRGWVIDPENEFRVTVGCGWLERGLLVGVSCFDWLRMGLR